MKGKIKQIVRKVIKINVGSLFRFQSPNTVIVRARTADWHDREFGPFQSIISWCYNSRQWSCRLYAADLSRGVDYIIIGIIRLDLGLCLHRYSKFQDPCRATTHEIFVVGELYLQYGSGTHFALLVDEQISPAYEIILVCTLRCMVSDTADINVSWHPCQTTDHFAILLFYSSWNFTLGFSTSSKTFRELIISLSK